MSGALKCGRGVAAIAGVYHLFVGLTLIASGETMIQMVRSLAGWTVEGTPAMGIVGEILGCYAIAFGLMMLLVAWDPARGRHFLSVGLVLIALRVFQRIWFADKVMETFQVSPTRHWLSLAIVAVMGLLLLAFRLHIGAAPRRPSR